MELQNLAEYVNLGLSLAFLSAGSVSDLRTREASDKLWLLYGPIAAAVTASRLLANPGGILLSAISIAVTVAFAFGLFYFGVFGGADAKAMMCLALAMPLTPTGISPYLGYAHPFFPIVVLVSGYFIAAFVTLYYVLKNSISAIERGGSIFQDFERERVASKLLAFATGYRTNLANLKRTFYLYPMEEVKLEGDTVTRRLRLFVGAEADRDELVENLEKGLGDTKSDVWVTPGLPMLVFLTAGLLTAVFAGDPLLWIVYNVLSGF